MLYALDLFSGIGGNSLALRGYAESIAYCEADPHAQAVLISRMANGSLPRAPICTDVSELDGRGFRGLVDIIVAGFPCQDISCAGTGKGLEGERSGLFFEIVRLAKEVEPTFLFLENVPAIRTRGLDRVIQELTALGYDLRWTMLSAAAVGAPHKRQRWFLLAYAAGHGNQRALRGLPCSYGTQKRSEKQIEEEADESTGSGKHAPVLADASGNGWITRGTQTKRFEGATCSAWDGWWSAEPDVGRVVNGLPFRVDRIKRLGNAVVPAQAKAAFEMLMGVHNGVSI